jgi:hypothetical protein
MPPEHVAPLALALSVKAICSNTSLTHCFSAAPPGPYLRPQNVRLSRALSMLYKAI